MGFPDLLTDVKKIVKNILREADVWLQSCWEGKRQRNEVVVDIGKEKIFIGRLKGKWYLAIDDGAGLLTKDRDENLEKILKYLELMLRGRRIAKEVLEDKDLNAFVEYKERGSLTIEFDDAEMDVTDFLDLVRKLESKGFLVYTVSGSFFLEGRFNDKL